MMSDVMFDGIMRLLQIGLICCIFALYGMIIADILEDRRMEKKLRSSNRTPNSNEDNENNAFLDSELTKNQSSSRRAET